ncbi:MAG TPA: type II toxin-antitoxin system VapC family toxin [Nakamurella sp.]|jgi:predicted nucleic acid-binding protein
MIVIDASALLDLILLRPNASRVEEALRGQDVAAPELLLVETCSALARLERAGDLLTRDADVAIRDVGELPISLVGHSPLHTRAWALRGSLRVADAFYVACAELLATPLVTSDVRLARAPLSGVAITLVR